MPTDPNESIMRLSKMLTVRQFVQYVVLHPIKAYNDFCELFMAYVSYKQAYVVASEAREKATERANELAKQVPNPIPGVRNLKRVN